MIVMVDVEEVLRRLEALADVRAAEGMARYGIRGRKVYGVSIANLRRIAREIGRNHRLALELWRVNSRETRILASMIDDPELVTEEQMEEWVKDFDCWEICDQVCQNLFIYTRYARGKIFEWSRREEEFVRRAALAMIAWLAFKDKSANDGMFEEFFPIIKNLARDDRIYVRKAVSWALRQIGKRSLNLNGRAIEVAREISEMENKGAKWIARDVLKELRSKKVLEKLKSRMK